MATQLTCLRYQDTRECAVLVDLISQDGVCAFYLRIVTALQREKMDVVVFWGFLVAP